MGLILGLATGVVATSMLVGILVKLLINIAYHASTGKEPSFLFALLYYVALAVTIWFVLPQIENVLIGKPPFGVQDNPLSQLVVLSPLLLIGVLFYAGIKLIVRLVRKMS